MNVKKPKNIKNKITPTPGSSDAFLKDSLNALRKKNTSHNKVNVTVTLVNIIDCLFVNTIVFKFSTQLYEITSIKLKFKQTTLKQIIILSLLRNTKNMKKLVLLLTILLCVSCDKDEIDDKVNEYKNKPRSEDLKGFWKLKGLYKSKDSQIPSDLSINNGGIAGIGLDEILYLDNNYLRFLNKVNQEDTYSVNSKHRFYWYNENNFIKSVYQEKYSNQNSEILQEFQLPYKFGNSKDTLIVQNNGRIMYLLKTENVDFTEYSFE